MSKSGSANEALQIYRGGRTLLQESRVLKTRLESVLLDLFNTKSRQEALRFSPVNVGRLKELHGITIFDNDLLNDVRTFVEKAGPDVINRYKEKVKHFRNHLQIARQENESKIEEYEEEIAELKRELQAKDIELGHQRNGVGRSVSIIEDFQTDRMGVDYEGDSAS